MIGRALKRILTLHYLRGNIDLHIFLATKTLKHIEMKAVTKHHFTEWRHSKIVSTHLEHSKGLGLENNVSRVQNNNLASLDTI